MPVEWIFQRESRHFSSVIFFYIVCKTFTKIYFFKQKLSRLGNLLKENPIWNIRQLRNLVSFPNILKILLVSALVIGTITISTKPLIVQNVIHTDHFDFHDERPLKSNSWNWGIEFFISSFFYWFRLIQYKLRKLITET